MEADIFIKTIGHKPILENNGGLDMTCFHPLKAYRLLTERTEKGKSVIVFNRKEIKNRVYEPIKVKCNQCMGCRVAKSREWAVRCVHESEMHDENCFITLTFNEKNIEDYQSLDKKDFQLFMKRLRKKYTGKKIRYFHCGEYGDKLKRPHHHACIFGLDFEDKILWQVREGNRLYRSETLEKLWPFGYSLIGDVTFQSAAYVARYITKKINGERKEAHYKRVNKTTGEQFVVIPEYITMSKNPGIGKDWFNKFGEDVYPKDFLTLGGKKFRSPKYYDDLYDRVEPEKLQKIKKRRKEHMQKRKNDNTTSRLRVKETILNSRLKKQIRSI